MIKLAVLLTLLPCVALASSANYDAVLQGDAIIYLNRPVIVEVVPTLPNNRFAEAGQADGAGTCIIRIRRDKLWTLYHELQHCAGVKHKGGE